MAGAGAGAEIMDKGGAEKEPEINIRHRNTGSKGSFKKIKTKKKKGGKYKNLFSCIHIL